MNHNNNPNDLLDIIQVAAAVDVYDDQSRGLFGDLYGAAAVWQALLLQQQPGGSNAAAQPPQVNDENLPHLRSLSSSAQQEHQEIMLCIDNTTAQSTVVVRWINEHGAAEQLWGVPPGTSNLRFGRAGHLFVLTTTVAVQSLSSSSSSSSSSEHLLGAYRIGMALPSEAPHLVRIIEHQQQDDEPGSSSTATSDSSSSWYLLENILTDATDELLVAAAALDTKCHMIGRRGCKR